MQPFLAPAAGGALIGLSASLLMLANGRIAGISGMCGGILARSGARLWQDVFFLAGLVLGPLAYIAAAGSPPQVHAPSSWPLLAVAGLLVGFGTRMGSGCTSGHGIAGLARLSPRSIAAVLTFLATAMLTVFLMRIGGAA